MKKVVEMTHDILQNYIKEDAIAVDFTLGNGFDTLFFAKQKLKKIYAFDIQAESLKRTQALLEHEIIQTPVECILDGHEHMDAYVDVFDVGIFNFGYLPSLDKTLTTKLETSRIAVAKALERLALHGALLLVLYPGHEEGRKEYTYFLQMAKELASKRYATCHIELPNKCNAPSILVIEKQS